jgi:hypothetical protein
LKKSNVMGIHGLKNANAQKLESLGFVAVFLFNKPMRPIETITCLALLAALAYLVPILSPGPGEADVRGPARVVGENPQTSGDPSAASSSSPD